MTPSQAARRLKVRPKKTPGEHYTPNSYREAIVRACGKATVPARNPNRLRHNEATGLRKEFGLDAAREILGHSSPAATEHDAELDMARSSDVIPEIG
jgi:integrase